jgi:putative flippase GtrA
MALDDLAGPKPRSSSATGQAGRFAIVGVVNTCIDLFLFAALSLAGWPLLLANLVSTTAGMTFGFFAHRSFSFRSTASVRESAPRFVVTTGLGLWAVQPLVIWVTGLLLVAALGASSVSEVWLPKLVAIAAGMVWNFVAYRLFVFVERAA